MHRRAFLGLPAAALALGGCERPAPIEGGFTGINDQRGHALRDMREAPAPQATRRTQVLIAGGGVAGLAAARALRQRGIAARSHLAKIRDGIKRHAAFAQLAKHGFLHVLRDDLRVLAMAVENFRHIKRTRCPDAWARVFRGGNIRGVRAAQ